MEGWRQRRPGSNAKPLGEKRKSDLTLTGLLMEGLCFAPLPQTQHADSNRLQSAAIIGGFSTADKVAFDRYRWKQGLSVKCAGVRNKNMEPVRSKIAPEDHRKHLFYET